MAGFKDFLMRGNLVDVAVAFIIGAAFGTVTTSFTKLVMDLIGKLIGGQPDFSSVAVGGVNIGGFITALVSFAITATVVYFGVVKPYELLRTKLQKPKPVEETAATSEDLLAEIRDLLKAQGK
jgi:large conductance mechanosensitive channel